VLSLDPGQGFNRIVETLNGCLRSIRVGSEVGGCREVVEVEARELIESGVADVRYGGLAEEAGVAEANSLLREE